jgi:hypothetical protein
MEIQPNPSSLFDAVVVVVVAAVLGVKVKSIANDVMACFRYFGLPNRHVYRLAQGPVQPAEHKYGLIVGGYECCDT